MREMEKMQKEREQFEKEKQAQRFRMEKNEELKAKIRMYKEYKARFIMEI